MRSRVLILSLFTVAFILSGCYTQLQYSQGINRITDVRPTTPGYSWDGDEENKEAEKVPAARENEDSDYTVGYEDGYRQAVDDIPIHYRDYSVASWYDRHFYYHNPFYDGYYPYGSGFSVSFYYGSPYRLWHLAFADPFDYYWFYHSPFRFYRPYSYYPGFYAHYFGPRYNFYPSYYFFQTGYADFVGTGKESNRKYGRRTIGTDRVASEENRYDRTENNNRNRASVQKAKKERSTTVVRRSRGDTDTDRSRSVRSRSSSDSGSRVRATGRSGSRSSGRGNVDRSRTRDRDNDYRTRTDIDTGGNNSTGVRIDPEKLLRDRNRNTGADRAEVQNRLRNNRAPDIDGDKINRERFEDRINKIRRYQIFDSMSGKSIDNSRSTAPSRRNINSSSSKTRSRSHINSGSRSSSSNRGRSSSSSGSRSGSSSKKKNRGGN